jgi:Uma2 family endonuclease
VLATGFAAYPDVAVVCGPLELDPDSDATVTNPTLLVEVLSTSTQTFDRGEKFEHYQRIPALRAVLFVSQDEARVELRARDAQDGWSSCVFAAGESVPLAALGVRLEVDALYADARVAR